MDNPEKLATFGTQDTVRKQRKQITTQKTTKMSNSKMLDITICITISIKLKTKQYKKKQKQKQQKYKYISINANELFYRHTNHITHLF